MSLDGHRRDIERFFRLAIAKRARLIIFPELAGTMLAAPLMGGVQAALLKRADRARRRQASLWDKLSGSLAGTASRMLGVNYRRLMAGLLEMAPTDLWDTYIEFYSGLAREYDITVVAPSAYLPDPLDGVIRNIAAVFGPDGTLLGYQPKVMVHPNDENLGLAGTEWQVIQTEVGRLGLMLGSDVLYPEVGRLLAYQGAEILIGQGAATNVVLYEKLRSGMLARMQENQLFGAISFVVGHNELFQGSRQPFIGKSAIFAPQELTPRNSGVLVEMSNYRSESVLTAIWDFPALQELWETSDTPLRKQIPVEQAGRILGELYQRLQRLPAPSDVSLLPVEETPPVPLSVDYSLDDLPVLASVTARWPLDNGKSPTGQGWQHVAGPEQELIADEDEAILFGSKFDSPTTRQTDSRDPDDNQNDDGTQEDETQEMDALLRPDAGAEDEVESDQQGEEAEVSELSQDR
jgi:predicted amidohydrolase